MRSMSRASTGSRAATSPIAAWSEAAPLLQLYWEARLVEVDAVTVHWNAFCEQKLSLCLSLRDCSVCSDDAVPGEVVVRCEDAPDEAGRASIDVAVRTNVALRDRTDPLDDALGAGVPVGRVRATRPGWAAATSH